jgi:multiple sugar transport system permease protein
MLTTATHTQAEIYANNPPYAPGFRHFGDLFGVKEHPVPIGRWLWNSALIALASAAVSVVLAVPTAYALSRFRFRGKGALGFALFATQMLPEALLVVPLYALFLTLGLTDSLWSLILADTAFSLPVAVWVIKGAVDAIPYELEESGRIDGCSTTALMSVITMPLAIPSIAAAAIISFFNGWNEFLFANTFIASESSWPASKGLASFIGQFSTPLDTVMAAGILFAAPAVLFFLVAQRSIMGGLTAGAIKG